MEQGKEENVRDYFSRIEKLVNEMKNNGDEITEKDVLKKIMRTQSSRFDYVVTAIEESKDLNTMTFNDLQASLESREMWMNERSQSSMEQALKPNLETKGYKLYNPKTKKVIINRDVTFDEDEVWDCSEEEKRSLPAPDFFSCYSVYLWIPRTKQY
ncbi:hypothetical protein RJ639_019852 [Escallonia herrerae]|uniref:Retroviral polymerase SH3-like domain-containing protein n=1 Tax=Escallonia herrerae TaxID=1293975 RepID=A0AA89AIC6_9ASTE|nr:hypothetical protein RJ639_019852 [Escallonia herrerae]